MHLAGPSAAARYVDAATKHNVDIVALSFTAVMPAQAIANGLTDLRQPLPANVRVWVGGSSPALRRKFTDGVHYVAGLTPIDETVADWRRSAVL